MTTVETILSCVTDGRMTRRESLAALARLITRENVAEVLAALPADVAADMERWAATVPMQEGVVLGANVSGGEGQRLAESLRAASRAIQEWAARNGGPGNMAGQGVEVPIPAGSNSRNGPVGRG